MSLTTRLVVGGAVLSVLTAASPALAASSPAVRGSVFKDLDRSGTRSADEAGVSGMYVYLETPSGSVVDASTTGTDGGYVFSGVADGSYRVEIGGSSWSDYQNDWVPTTTGTSLYPRTSISVAGGDVTASFGIRPIVRSTTSGSPITTATGPAGVRVESYDDVVPATELYDALVDAGFIGDEGSHVLVQFDLATVSATSTGVDRDASGRYSNYSARSSVTYGSWAASHDQTLFHEYGHAWSLYFAYIVQQDPSLTGYLRARGLGGDSRVGSSYEWDPKEMIAEDYRQLFGSATAAAPQQMNAAIPPASQVPGLKTYLATTFRATTAPAAPVNLAASTSSNRVALAWSAASSGGAPSSYNVFRDGAQLGSSTSTSFVDATAKDGSTYTYTVSAVNSSGESARSNGVTVSLASPVQVSAVAMSPSPVKSSGTASFRISAAATVTARIETTSGGSVRTLLNAAAAVAGTTSVSWSRTNDAGKRVSSGTYVLRVSADSGGTTSTSTATFSVS